MGGQRLVVAGTVLTTDCRPVQQALLDFWQADDAGEYDNQGYRLRATSSTTPMAPGAWRRCCRASTPAAPATSTSRSRPPTAPSSPPSSTSPASPATTATASSSPSWS